MAARKDDVAHIHDVFVGDRSLEPQGRSVTISGRLHFLQSSFSDFMLSNSPARSSRARPVRPIERIAAIARFAFELSILK